MKHFTKMSQFLRELNEKRKDVGDCEIEKIMKEGCGGTIYDYKNEDLEDAIEVEMSVDFLELDADAEMSKAEAVLDEKTTTCDPEFTFITGLFKVAVWITDSYGNGHMVIADRAVYHKGLDHYV